MAFAAIFAIVAGLVMVTQWTMSYLSNPPMPRRLLDALNQIVEGHRRP